MATVAAALPTFIHDDVPTQSLLDEMRRLEGERAQIQAAHRRRASDDTAAMIQYFGMELDEVGFIMRDRLWALILGRGEDADDARVQIFFTALITQVQAHIQAEVEATVPVDITNAMDEAENAGLQHILDNELPVNDRVGHVSAPANPVVALAPLPPVPPPVAIDSPVVIPAVVANTPPEV